MSFISPIILLVLSPFFTNKPGWGHPCDYNIHSVYSGFSRSVSWSSSSFRRPDGWDDVLLRGLYQSPTDSDPESEENGGTEGRRRRRRWSSGNRSGIIIPSAFRERRRREYIPGSHHSKAGGAAAAAAERIDTEEWTQGTSGSGEEDEAGGGGRGSDLSGYRQGIAPPLRRANLRKSSPPPAPRPPERWSNRSDEKERAGERSRASEEILKCW